MKQFLECIEEFEKRLEKEIMDIVEDESIPLSEKNRLMAPIADQKKVITSTKSKLFEIDGKQYEAKCEMYKFQ